MKHGDCRVWFIFKNQQKPMVMEKTEKEWFESDLGFWQRLFYAGICKQL